MTERLFRAVALGIVRGHVLPIGNDVRYSSGWEACRQSIERELRDLPGRGLRVTGRYRLEECELVPNPEGQWVHVKDIGIKEWVLDQATPLSLLAIERDARRLVDALGFYETDGREKVSWPVDRDGESTPAADALAINLRNSLGGEV